MKIMVFLHGTATRPSRTDPDGHDFVNYQPTGKVLSHLFITPLRCDRVDFTSVPGLFALMPE